MIHHPRKNKVRQPAAAGTFYPNNWNVLKRMVEGFLSHSRIKSDDFPKILIVPHAGYFYSGKIAGKGYELLLGCSGLYTHVAILGPPHHVYLDSVGTTTEQIFLTPLGSVAVDNNRVDQLKSRLNSIVYADNAHLEEHCIEVQLPFLQTVIGNFKLLPFLVGNLLPDSVAKVIAALMEFNDTLIIISTDLSHYLTYENAKKTDSITAERIESLDYHTLDDRSACGIWALRGALFFAKENRLLIRRLALQNSGDTSGLRRQVVGYGAWALFDSGK